MRLRTIIKRLWSLLAGSTQAKRIVLLCVRGFWSIYAVVICQRKSTERVS